MTAELRDTPMSDALDDNDVENAVGTLNLSDDEKRVLALYDQLRSIRLEIALLKARESFTEARASYVLRNEVVDSVLTVNPVLKAVHGATQASPIERDLLLAIKQRDSMSKAVAQDAMARRDARDESATVAVELRRLEKQNAQLAAQARQLAAVSAATEGNAGAEDAALEKELQADVKTSRQRWKLIKGTASAIVVGSGVDWTREAALCDIVLDPE
ncbi:hypothetical protein Sste5344_003641 [Sporothrix stenoceras]